ncbi:uncharacterized protein LOC107772521 [Nicotiana tabacum]|uniref:Uncharacterized protein LOC107772521 n=1 Tax=Nicotiana tabacum TaxID=4097 RepID=A0AC58SRK0_TOBAC
MGEVISKNPEKHVSSSPSSSESERDELQLLEHAPPFWRNRKRLSKQLSMCETPRDIAWEKHRRQILLQERRKQGIHDPGDLTDENLNELKGCIELGFGFNEEEGQRLCSTLPALDLYFAVNRQYSTSPISSHSSKSLLPSPAGSSSSSTSLGGRSSSFGSLRSDSADAWRNFSPDMAFLLRKRLSLLDKVNKMTIKSVLLIICAGDDPQQVKTKLRHWAHAVACSVMQSH